MTSKDFGRSGFMILAVLGFMTAIFMELAMIRRLQRENADLRKEVAALKGGKNAGSAKGEITPEELEKLRQAKSELIRLRGQYAVLRKMLQDGPEKKAEVPPPPPSAAPEEPPVHTYTTTASAQLKPDEIMVTGGWSTHAGKSVWIVISPTIGNPNGTMPGQITLEHKIIEVPDQVASNLGLAELKTTQSKTSRHGVFDAQQTEVFWKQLEDSDGVDVLSSPKIITLSGREAQVSALSAVVIGGMQYQLGPTLNIIPTALDGGELSLKVVGVITLRNEKAK